MTNTNDNDIDALLDALVPIASGFGDCDICKTDALRCHAALTALWKERDELLKENVALRDRLKAKQDEVMDREFEMDVLRKQREEAKADFVDAWRERSEFAKRIYEADAALADVLQAVQKSHDAMVLAKTSHGCFLACDPPLDAWKYRCVDAHLGDAIRECAAAMRKEVARE